MDDNLLTRINKLQSTILEEFQDTGAKVCEVPSLLPAEVLLDLYGEDIRMRAYTTADPVNGELVLRPDFTVPIVQQHMLNGANRARYCYSGTVWRRPMDGASQASEHAQVGYELFDDDNTARADAEVFTLFDRALEQFNATPCMGDVSILRSAVIGLDASPKRRAALLRHVWRQERFTSLLARFGGQRDEPIGRQAFLQSVETGIDTVIANAGPHVGLRSVEEIKQRTKTLQSDQSQPPIPAEQVSAIYDILNLRDDAGSALGALRDLSLAMPCLDDSLNKLEARLDALAKQGVDVDLLNFDGSYGLDAMEYYDGFVFGFSIKDTLVASGGRYDALTSVLGQGRSVAAVGGIIRPALVLSKGKGGV